MTQKDYNIKVGMRELVIYQTETGGWEARYEKLPGYCARGATKEEAIENIKRAITIYNPCRCED